MPIRTSHIRIPVRLVDGDWELQYGGPVRVKNGCTGELLVSRDQIEDKAFLDALTEKRWVRILDQGTELRVALTIRDGLYPSLARLLVPYGQMKWDPSAKISDRSRFVSVFLRVPTEAQSKRREAQGGLWLELEGMEPRRLESSHVLLPPALDLPPAISVNHSFALLSEHFEPWRKSHTGNIYERVFYRETNGCCIASPIFARKNWPARSERSRGLCGKRWRRSWGWRLCDTTECDP